MGIDLGDTWSRLCVLDDGGTVREASAASHARRRLGPAGTIAARSDAAGASTPW
jgi:hypothetical protein